MLVGDSLGRVILGYENEIRVTMADMLHHMAAVVRGTQRALVIGDMPFLSYSNPDEALENAGRFLQEAGAQAVKVEGGVRTARTIETVVKAGIPVMGHIGLTPQAINAIGKVRVQGKTRDQARSLLADALAVQEAGGFAVVLELVPEQLAAAITARLRIPTIGIGAGRRLQRPGPGADRPARARFLASEARPAYANLRETVLEAARSYASDVEAGTFPGPAETVRMDDEVLSEVLGRTADDRAEVTSGGIPLDRDL